MPHLSRVQEEARQQIRRLALLDLPPERIGARVLDAVELAVPSTGLRLFGVDAATLLINRLLAAREEDGENRLIWLRDVYLSTPLGLDIVQFPVLMRAGVPAVAIVEQQERSWGLLPWMREAMDAGTWHRWFVASGTPPGGTVFASFAVDGKWVACMGLHQRDPKRRYQAGEIAFLRLVGPPIGRAVAAALAREQARLAGAAPVADCPTGSGVLALADDGRVTFSTPAGERWSDLLLEREPADPGRLPAVVRALVADLQRGGELAGGTLIVPTRAGRVRLEASRSVSDDATAIIFTPERPPAPPEIPASWPLTASEREVVNLLIRGRSDRQISDRLFISESTVRTHLRHAYEKLDVHSRTQLLARLFAESYWPILADGGEEGEGGADVETLPARLS